MSDSEIVIKVENLWKEYRYGTISHATLRRDLQSWWARLRGKPDPNIRIDFNQAPSTKHQSPITNHQSPDRFWALKDISFEVKKGEVLGIIGKNGAGKSTLLKIMSRVTTPTRGQIKIKGRIASLLEVGTGFHPELTGRENIFLNGAILGMNKEEIRKKFDEILAFAEIVNFIDTPVKRYSSGMYVRLAFAVAAHLEPEILLVDEVLAVGDAAFQKKCIGKMDDVAKEGRTVLFVSHNMGAVIQLCPSSVLINDGQMDAKGPSTDIVEKYLSGTIMGVDKQVLRNRPVKSGDDRLRFLAAHLQKGSGECTLI
jgi:lipopolysaccharide transport system ATP-binding protein